MHNSTEEEILTILSKNRPMTVLQIANSINLTKADIRYHLKNLLRKGKISKTEPIIIKRGRPAVKFFVSNSYFNHNLVVLVNALFSLIPPESNIYSKLADYFSKEIHLDGNLPFISKMNTLIINLNLQNYFARWETHFQGPVIFFSNCPYRQINRDFPGLCKMDQEILENCLNTKVKLIDSISKSETAYCKFQLFL